jgi:heme/copper-type cytochrome/quinol oxidase subunit 3
MLIMVVHKQELSQDAAMSDGAIIQLGRMLILAGSTFFAPFFFAYAVLFVSNSNSMWRPAPVTHPSQALGILSVAFLIASGLIYLWGQMGLSRGEDGRFANGMLLALTFSVAASVCYVITLRHLGFSFESGGYATVFICLTNVYLALQLVVDLYLLGLFNRARLQLYSKDNMATVSAFGEVFGWFIAVGALAYAALYILPFINPSA